MVLSRLRGSDDRNFLQAIDELNAFDLLSKDGLDIRYEEDVSSPDFRIYRGSDYVAGIEICSLFPNKRFVSEISRNDRLVVEVNSRVRIVGWYVLINTIKWKQQPRIGDIARWFNERGSVLPRPWPGITREDYPTGTYASPEVEFSCTFIPRQSAPSQEGVDRLVVGGPPVFESANSEQRIRNSLGAKAGSKYEHLGRPFAIFVSVRDYSDTEDIVNALYGDDILRVDINGQGAVVRDRRRNGFFAVNNANPVGRNRRVSCVLVLTRGWIPGSGMAPKVLRFDNPCGYFDFPNDLFVAYRRFKAFRDQSGIRMEWEKCSD